MGTTPATVAGVGYGRHLLTVSSYRYAVSAQVVEVGQPEVKVSVALKALVRGRLRVNTVPDGAEVFLNGSPKGKTPLSLDELLPGKYELRLEADGCFTHQEGLEIEPGREAKLDRTLESKSETFLLDAIARDPNRVVNYYDLAHYYVQSNQFEKAFQMFGRGFDACVTPGLVTSEQRRIYDEFERVWDGQYNFADDEVRQGLRPRIFRELEDAISRRPRNVLNHWSLGQFYEKMDDWQHAAEAYERGFAAVKSWRARLYLEHNLAQARYHQGFALEKEKKYDEALALYEALLRDHPKVYYSRSAAQRVAAIWSNREEWTKAIEARQRIIALFPDGDTSPETQMEIAQLCLNRLKDPAKALEAYRAYLERYPTRDNCPSIQLAIASVYRDALKDLPGALHEYERFLKTYPESDSVPTALQSMMQVYRMMSQPPTSDPTAREKVEELRKRIATEYPWSSEALYAETDPAALKARREISVPYRDAVALAKDDPRKAIEALRDVVNKFPRSYYARAAQQQIISLYTQPLKEYEKAIEAREEYIRLFPESDQCPSQLYQIGYSRVYQLDQFDEGVAALRRFLKTYPESDLCAQAQYYLASLYSFTRGHYDRAKNIEENRRLIHDYPNSDRNGTAQVQIALNFYYQFEPGDKEIAQRELLKAVQDYPYGSYATQAEYYLDLMDAGLQLDENAYKGSEPQEMP